MGRSISGRNMPELPTSIHLPSWGEKLQQQQLRHLCEAAPCTYKCTCQRPRQQLAVAAMDCSSSCAGAADLLIQPG